MAASPSTSTRWPPMKWPASAGSAPPRRSRSSANPGWLVPYIACILVGLGLTLQFGTHLLGFARRRIRGSAAPAPRGDRSPPRPRARSASPVLTAHDHEPFAPMKKSPPLDRRRHRRRCWSSGACAGPPRRTELPAGGFRPPPRPAERPGATHGFRGPQFPPADPHPPEPA